MTLAPPDLTDRVEARKELVRRGPKARDLVLRKFISGGLDGDGRLAALGVLQAHWNADVEDLFRLLLNDASPDVRRLAADGLGCTPSRRTARDHEALVEGCSATTARPSGGPAALALGRVGGDGAPTPWSTPPGRRRKDAFLTDAYLRGLERLGKPGIDALLALAASGRQGARPRRSSAFLALRTKPAADALPELLANPHLTAASASLVRSYTNYQFDPPLSLDPLADVPDRARRTSRPSSIAAAGGVRRQRHLIDAEGDRARRSACSTPPDAETRLAAIKRSRRPG